MLQHNSEMLLTNTLLGLQEYREPSAHNRSIKPFTSDCARKGIVVCHVKVSMRTPRFAGCCFLESRTVFHVTAESLIDGGIQRA